MDRYKNKLFSILGDSISTFEGVTPKGYNVFYTDSRKLESGITTADKTWWGRVIKELGGELLVNNSWSGSLVCKHPECEIESYGASDARTSALDENCKTPDVIMVYIGTNDWGYNMPIDPPKSKEGDLSVFRIAYNTMLHKIKANYPKVEVWCFTLAVSDSMRDFGFTLPLSKEKTSMLKYCQAIKDCAKENDCLLIDIFDADNAYETMDNLHPDCQGMKSIADLVLRQLKLFKK